MTNRQPGMHPQTKPTFSFNVSRRSFLQRCSVAAATTGLPLWFLQRELAAAEPTRKPLSANDRPGIALVGCGGMGQGDAGNASRFGDIVAVCDADASHADAAVKKFTKNGKVPAKYDDFRKLLERDDVHAFINATPDHWHTLVNLAATKARKDVYGEKPLTLSIEEGQRLVKAVRSSGIVLQTGTQQRSDRRFRLACELVRNGRLGKLKQVTVWLPAGLREGPFKTAPVPSALNWDLWQGQAPAVEYVPQRCHTTFRFWYEYSGGTMTDWGAHHIDIAFWALGLPASLEIEGKPAVQPIPGGYTAFSEYEVKFTYADGPVLVVRTTKDDNIFGGIVKEEGQRNGIHFEGADGWLWVNRGEMTASDEAIYKTPLPENAKEKLPVSSDHMGNFFNCVRSRELPICEVAVGHRSASICHLAVISLRTGQKLKWDTAKELFVGDHAAEANAMIARPMRKPYDYSYVS